MKTKDLFRTPLEKKPSHLELNFFLVDTDSGVLIHNQNPTYQMPYRRKAAEHGLHRSLHFIVRMTQSLTQKLHSIIFHKISPQIQVNQSLVAWENTYRFTATVFP